MQQPLDDHQGMLIPTFGEIVQEAMAGGPFPLEDALNASANALSPEQMDALIQWLTDGQEAKVWNAGDEEE